MRRRFPLRCFLLLTLCAAFLVSGCGKKGALYLPDQPRPPVQDESP